MLAFGYDATAAFQTSKASFADYAVDLLSSLVDRREGDLVSHADAPETCSGFQSLGSQISD